ncbi:MAG: POTRA domain-containing protein, partial [Candidatus Acidiferrales bacterium]
MLAALTLASGASAQEQPANTAAGTATLKNVTVSGSLRFTPGQVAAAGGLTVGKPVTREQMQIAADELGRLGLFSSVQYRFRSYLDGVTLEFELKDAPLLPVHFDNFPWVT